MRIAESVTFGGSSLERAAHVRGDAAAICGLMAKPDAGVMPIWRGKPLLDSGQDEALVWLDKPQEMLDLLQHLKHRVH